MPKTSTKAEFNYFVKGLISEASPLNFPENASQDEENFELERDGTRSRRLGMDIESGGTLRPMDNPASLFEHLPSAFKWKEAGFNSDKDFAVVQDGNHLHMFDMTTDILSTNGFISTVTLSSLPVNANYSFTSVDGRLVVVCGASDVAIVSYDNDVFEVEYTRLKTRDLWGIPTGIDKLENDVSYRGEILPLGHYYNLQNQSWGIPRKDKDGNLIDPIIYYKNQLTKVPSNSEVVWTGLQYQPVSVDAEPFERIYPNMYTELLGATIKAPKGYYIIDVLERGPSRISVFNENSLKYPQQTYTILTTTADTTTQGASFVAEFAGRVFYAGFGGEIEDKNERSPNLANHVFFSQLVKNKADYSKCYQDGDPTARESAEVVDTDGGFIRVSGAERIVGLSVLGNALIVIATNGIWSIVGGSEYGFTATNYKVDKLTSFGCAAYRSVIGDGGQLFYWALDGIYVVAPDKTGMLSVQSITETTIKKTYQSIDNFSKSTASGVYDSLNKKVRWIYRTGNLFTESSETFELILDLVLGAFYKNRINNNEGHNEIISALDGNQYRMYTDYDTVVAGTVPVIVDDVPLMYAYTAKVSADQNLKYLMIRSVDGVVSYSFSQYNNPSFKDWNEIDAEGYLLTGAITATDTSAKKQVPYLLTMMRATESGVDTNGNFLTPSGCTMQFQWDWTDNPLSNRWTNSQELYRLKRTDLRLLTGSSTTSGFPVVTSKTKIRGRGRAFSMLLKTEPGKDCKLLGWNMSLNAAPIT